MAKKLKNTQYQNGMSELLVSASSARDWLVNKALPFWADNARDAQGGFCEELNQNGEPNWSAIRRLRVQARQIYAYALGFENGWTKDRSVTDHSLDFMLAKGFMPDEKQGFIALLDKDLQIYDDRRDLYDHAFYLLALAWHSRICDGFTTLALADCLIAFLDENLGADNGGWYEGLPKGDPRNVLRRQNPHMHLFEAFMVLYDASGNEKYLRRASDIFELFKTHFFDPQTAVISEYFHHDWVVAKNAKGKIIEPGHMAEWVWLLGQYEHRTGINTRKWADKLYNKLLEFKQNWLVDEMDRTGNIIRATSRLWVQTEMCKAHIAQAEFGDKYAPELAARLLSRIQKHYLQDNGTWVDVLGENGLPLIGAIPTSTFYHIICMIAEAARITGLGNIDKKVKKYG